MECFPACRRPWLLTHTNSVPLAIGGLIGAYLQWRWVFWIVCILVSYKSHLNYRPPSYCFSGWLCFDLRAYCAQRNTCPNSAASNIRRNGRRKARHYHSAATSSYETSQTFTQITGCSIRMSAYLRRHWHLKYIPHGVEQNRAASV